MSHDHTHAPVTFGKAFAIGITLNLVFVAVEAFYGWRSGSLAPCPRCCNRNRARTRPDAPPVATDPPGDALLAIDMR